MYIWAIVLQDTEPLFLLTAVILYAIMLVLRYKTGARVYNLVGIAILVFMAQIYIHATAMVIGFVALIIYQLYDTFFGGKQ